MHDSSDARALLERSASCLLDSLSAVEESVLESPTPCPKWSVRDLVLHVAEAADELVSRGNGSPAQPGSATGPVAVARAHVVHLVAVVAQSPADDAEARSTTEVALGGSIELSAHAWDLDTATGRPGLPLDHAADVLGLAQRLVDDEARAAFFGPIVQVGADASASDRLAAFLGRDPGWVTRTRSPRGVVWQQR
ncbi:MAG: maleylpyruvate isomerase family mycothiol-dependent enzyme [Aeromicrobium sp.]|uniref:maleylpyruvate isomerase family mycothiol-dependent enzyme n=1 Tax=Aeromicrobium sp. TaxID=1871063 RepID=UPI003C341591